MFLPPQARKDFFDIYGKIDKQTEEFALFRAIFFTVFAVVHTHTIGDKDFLADHLMGLQFIVDGYTA